MSAINGWVANYAPGMSIYGDIRVSDCNACFVLRSQSLSMFKAVAAAFEKFELHLTGV